MRELRDLAAVIAALTVMQAGVGALAVMTPLILSDRGASPMAVGLVGSGYALGFLFGAVAAARIITEIGHIRAFAAAAALACVFALALYMRVDALLWMVARFGAGACVALLFAAGESWIASSAHHQRRGAVLGAYLVLAKLGVIAGPFLIAGFTIGAAETYMIAAGLFALSLTPVAATRRAQPAPPSAEPFGPRRLAGVAPAAVAAGLIAGMVNGATAQLAPIYAGRLDPEAPAASAAAFVAAMMAGSLASQWPAGVVSDRLDRRLVIAALAAAAVVASVGLALLPPSAPTVLALILAALWGAGSMSFYGVAVAHAADRCAHDQATRMLSGMLMIWATGAVVGPVLAGAAMATPAGASGLFWFAALFLALLVAAMARRAVAEPGPAATDKEPFAPVNATSIAAAEIDPRAANEEEGPSKRLGAGGGEAQTPDAPPADAVPEDTSPT